MEFVTLNNGIKMPILGYGVFQIPDNKECEKCVRDALEVGYRHIDTAQIYGNEEGVGAAIANSKIKRSDLFVTTKLWFDKYPQQLASRAIDESLKKLKLDYVDLFLLHQPFGDCYAGYRALEEAYKSGKTKSIGVSNFVPDKFADIALHNEIRPQVNQIENHVFWQQKDAYVAAKRYKCQVESWAPFAEGKNDFFNNKILMDVGSKYNKTPAQVGLRYLIQLGTIVIPKSTHKDRMEQNFKVFDFKLNDDDMATVAKLDTGAPLFSKHNTVEEVERFSSYVGKKL